MRISAPTSARSAISCPNLPSVPVTSDSRLASSAIPSRWLCHCGLSERPRRFARSARTVPALSPSFSSVPAAPPNWTAKPCCKNVSIRTRCRSSGSIQLATLSPTVMAMAACMRVYPVSGLLPSRAAISPSVSMRRPSRAAMISAAAFSRSIRLVSMTSWLVAPKCSFSAAVPATAARICRTSSGTTTPSLATPCRSAVVSAAKSERRETIASAASASMTPAPACACASAVSKRIMASISALAENSSTISLSPKRPERNGCSKGERLISGYGSAQISKNTVSPSP
ncbi:hypothetical protein D3C87_1290560 [compost metagenome]